jgi:urease accessory protein
MRAPTAGRREATDALAVVRLLQLASPALPIGAYSYSQGLEWMVDGRHVRDEASAQDWIAGVLEHAMASGDAAVLWRLLEARGRGDRTRFSQWNTWYRASRETRELRAETEQMGMSLARLATELAILDDAGRVFADENAPLTLPAAFALAAHGFGIAAEAALIGYLTSWLENQVLAAIKAVPLGQVAGQRILLALGPAVAQAAQRAQALDDDDVASFAPGLALASARHETQYSRLFRS